LLGFEEPDTYRPVDNIVEQTQKYLDIITKENVPICFFVPQDYANHPSAKITKAEVDWYIQNPRRASNTYFIFGLFSAVNKAWYVNNRMNLIERVKAMAQAFKNIGVSRND
jgi:hypothetical protein